MAAADPRSLEERVAAWMAKGRSDPFEDYTDIEVGDMIALWDYRARKAQLPPPGDWATWLILAGRGFGKTRAGAEWVQGLALAEPGMRIALVGATLHDARAVMVEGDSGLLRIAAGKARPVFEPSLRQLRWENGSMAQLFSAAEPDSLRGPQFHAAWGDEIARWPDGLAVWRNLQTALRLGQRPRALLTTTPRPVPLVRMLMADAAVAKSRGRTADNPHLAAAFVTAVTAEHHGTRLGRQELDGELIEEVEGALWTRGMIEACRVRGGRDSAAWRRVVVGVDPPAGDSARSDACGIIVVALDADGRAVVLADASVQGLGPGGWAAAVADAAALHGADRVVAEANNGGAMVEAVLRAADVTMPVRLVRASRGKVARAEPVAALYAAGKVRHAGAFPALEDELCGLMTGGGYEGPGRSPDRADALVWAVSELLPGRQRVPGVRVL